MHPRQLTDLVIFVGLLALLAVFSVQVAVRNHPKNEELMLGATFSTTYAASLGLDVKRTYIAVLDELQVKHVRLPVYWSDVEPEERSYRFETLDWMVREAEQRGVELTLAVGRKVPRWPECYIPDWAEKLASPDQNQALLDFLENVVRRYDEAKAVVRWQVENEPFYNFGECPTPDAELFYNELELVRRISDKPIMLTTSGENEFWADAAIPADILGVSMYRATWNNIFGYSIYPVGPDFYAAKSALVAPLVDAVILSELQAEPWFRSPIQDSPPAELAEEFTPKELEDNLEFAADAGFHEVYLWGIEYWYWLDQQGESALWEKGREIFSL